MAIALSFAQQQQMHREANKVRLDQLFSALQQNDSPFLDSFGDPSTPEGIAQLNFLDELEPATLRVLLKLAEKVSERVLTLLLSSVAAPDCLDQENVLAFIAGAVPKGDRVRVANLHHSGCMKKLTKWQIGYIYVLSIECYQATLAKWLNMNYPFLKNEGKKFMRIYQVSAKLKNSV